MNNLIYLDNNSTTRTDDEVVDAMIPFFKDFYANPASFHNFGSEIRKKIKAAEEVVAGFIGATESEITFTSGSTEAINLALKGIGFLNVTSRKKLVTIATEHKAVLDAHKQLESRGFDITIIPVNQDGLVDLDAFRNAVDDHTLLVSVMLVNNETGVIQNIPRLASYAKQQGAYFLCDATQAAGRIPINVMNLNVDLLCLSGHKFYGPKGVGVLYTRSQNSLRNGFTRSGTLNVPGIIGLAKACEIAHAEMSSNENNIRTLRDELECTLLEIKGSFVNGSTVRRIYNTTNICFPSQEANVLIGRLKNIAVSNGSACTSFVEEPSHVLVGMGIDKDYAFSSIRFSLGKYNSADDIETAATSLKELIEGF